MKHYTWTVIAIIGILIAMVALELAVGRSFFGSDGQFGWWTSSIWSSEQSQRFFDVYSLSHILHGLAFYALLWIFCRKLPVRQRLVLAILFEAGWEFLENTSLIIDRYRAVTVSLGYYGDSILNSLGDVLMAGIGFLMAWKFRPWQSWLVVILIELALLFWIRDNLTLNLIMLVYPMEAIKNWQVVGAPGA